MGGKSIKDVGGAGFAGNQKFAIVSWERAAVCTVNVDVGPERRSPRYHESCLALESVEESSAAVLKARCVWLRAKISR